MVSVDLSTLELKYLKLVLDGHKDEYGALSLIEKVDKALAE